ncbi:Sulfoquinovosyl transferase [Actinidia chinensis var. chinensis]|uniref:Sulfoquinovosyl transferase n=1 Tax=Actinidia chinensis var. chinensis TaxID=1590841 RepID=A0A2R6RXB2_ACTCC|nr:Sulfoquinovosyl transferase [Actinidia chinensis var. chinensis]
MGIHNLYFPVIQQYINYNQEVELETHAKGEGSTKSTIRRGFELISDSSRGGGSSSSSLNSVIVISLAEIEDLFNLPLLGLSESKEWDFERIRQMGFALGAQMLEILREKRVLGTEEEAEEEVDKGGGGERSGFIERGVDMMIN